MTAEEIQELLKLEPLPLEGGYFVETYRSKFALAPGILPSGYPGERALSTAIYYMLTPDMFSALHRLKGDEIYHFYLGDPVEMLVLKRDGAGETFVIGQDIASGMRLQHMVPGGAWQGCRLAPGGRFALLGTTMSPGFHTADFELGRREELSALYGEYAGLIGGLTRATSDSCEGL